MDLSSILGPRSVDDMLAERVRVTVAGSTYVLPVKTMRAQREWEGRLDAELVRLLRLVQEDGDDVASVLRQLSESAWPFIDLLLSYDEGNILPDKDTIDAETTEFALLIACLEVWRAGHPKADIGLGLFALRKLMLDPRYQGLTNTPSPFGDTATDDSRPN